MSCRLTRLPIPDLADTLARQAPGLDTAAVRDILTNKVNSPLDDGEPGSPALKARASISAAEANLFIRKLFDGTLTEGTPAAAVASGLHRIFFPEGLRPFPSIPPTPVQVVDCHDGDTCRETETDPACPGPAQSVRLTGVDAPEVGGPKIAENVAKVVSESAALGTPIPPGMARERMLYTGKLSALVLNDAIRWIAAQGGRTYRTASQNRFARQPGLCGVWEPYDKYLRRLGGLVVEPPALLARYMTTRLEGLLRTEGEALHATFRAKPGCADLPHPSVLADRIEVRARIWETLVAGEPTKPLAGDLVALMVYLGLDFAYLKYRHQHGALYATLQDLARRDLAGNWLEPTFIHLYFANARDAATYNPPDCLAP